MDVEAELQTYKHSRQGLDEMYNEARRQLREESQLRQVSVLLYDYIALLEKIMLEKNLYINIYSFAFSEFICYL